MGRMDDYVNNWIKGGDARFVWKGQGTRPKEESFSFSERKVSFGDVTRLTFLVWMLD